MQNIVAHLRSLDWILIGGAVSLTGVGLISIYSSSIARDNFSNFEKQIVFLAIGLLAMFVISFFDYRLLRNNSYLILFLYIAGLVALAGLFVFAPEIRGTQRWYRIGSLSIDPVEYIKLVLIIIIAKYFALRHVELYRIRHVVLTGLYFFFPMLLVFFQPDLGSIILLVFLWVVLLLVAGIRVRHLFAIIAFGVLVSVLAWSVFLLDYQKARIMSFLEPELDPLGMGWSQLQSEIAIGSGGVFGKGFAQGTQTQYAFLSEPQTDFIFAAIAEEFGLVGISLIFLLLSILVWRIAKIGSGAKDNFSRLYAAGLITLFIAHTLINIGMNLGLLPIIGLSLPLVSYGGGLLIATYIGLGILLSIRVRNRE